MRRALNIALLVCISVPLVGCTFGRRLSGYVCATGSPEPPSRVWWDKSSPQERFHLLPDARVEVCDCSGDVIASTNTAEDGRFEFKFWGGASLVVSRPGFRQAKSQLPDGCETCVVILAPIAQESGSANND